MQGATHNLSEAEKAIYLHVNCESAKLLESGYDVFFVHDPQPAALRGAVGSNGAKWVWRCHIDTSSPNREVADFLLPYLESYDAVVFTMKEFLLPGRRAKHVAFVAPAIDPLSTKNMELPDQLCRDVVANAGVDTKRPFVVQVSRFDPWKDPMGVIEAYRLARKDVSGLQLALVGAIAGDDAEGWELLALVQKETADDDDIYVFTNLAGVGSIEVNAFQRASDLVIQKSLREGFGLVVSEAFWKGKPLVAGRAGGIPMQFPNGYESYSGQHRQRLGQPGLSSSSPIRPVGVRSEKPGASTCDADISCRGSCATSSGSSRACSTARRRARREPYWLPDPSELGGAPVVVVEAAEDGGFLDRPADGRWFGRPARNLLADALVRPCVVEVGAVAPEDRPEVILAADEHVVEALGAHAAQEALAERVRVRRSDGRAEDRDAGPLRHVVESRAELVVVVADQEARAFAPRRRLAELLGHPRARR